MLPVGTHVAIHNQVKPNSQAGRQQEADVEEQEVREYVVPREVKYGGTTTPTPEVLNRAPIHTSSTAKTITIARETAPKIATEARHILYTRVPVLVPRLPKSNF